MQLERSLRPFRTERSLRFFPAERSMLSERAMRGSLLTALGVTAATLTLAAGCSGQTASPPVDQVNPPDAAATSEPATSEPAASPGSDVVPGADTTPGDPAETPNYRLRIGIEIDKPGVGFLTQDGATGFDIDVAKYIAERLGVHHEDIQWV
ncbi:MAG: hypothetical protein LBB58_01995, partial [Cellulomonadaceae bacterium]|nr:hypothetical protein [Cellulomonadaceae bacterium]